MRWLYTQKLAAPPAAGSDEDDELDKLEDLDLIQLWVAADRLLIGPLQNCTIKTLSQLWHFHNGRCPSLEWMPYAYKHTVPGSPLRKLAVDLCLWRYPQVGTMLDEEEFRQNLPQELLFDMYKQLISALQSECKPVKRADPGDREYIVDERGHPVQPGVDEPFFSGLKYYVSRDTRSYLVPED